eukprot:Skav210883  [mRNA]  locus=scaffold3713:76926:85377:+ [translate_table: standard]
MRLPFPAAISCWAVRVPGTVGSMTKRFWRAACYVAAARWLWSGLSGEPGCLQFVGGTPKEPLARQPPSLKAASSLIPKEWHTAPQEITTQIFRCASASEVLGVLESEHRNPLLNLISISAAWVKIDKLQGTVSPKVAADPYWKHFVESTLRLLRRSLFEDPSIYARACSNMFKAAGNLESHPLLRSLVIHAQEDLGEGVAATAYFMNAEEVAWALRATPKLQLSNPTREYVLKALIQRLPDVAEDFLPEHLNSIFWAVAEHGTAAPQLLKQVPLMAEVLHDKVDCLGAEAVAGIILSISKLPGTESASARGEIPFLAARVRAPGVLGNMTGQMDYELMELVEEVVLAKADKLKPKSVEYDLPQILLGFARLEVPGAAMDNGPSLVIAWESAKFVEFCKAAEDQIAAGALEALCQDDELQRKLVSPAERNRCDHNGAAEFASASNDAPVPSFGVSAEMTRCIEAVGAWMGWASRVELGIGPNSMDPRLIGSIKDTVRLRALVDFVSLITEVFEEVETCKGWYQRFTTRRTNMTCSLKGWLEDSALSLG